MTVGTRLRDLRQNARLSQAELAKRAGVTTNTIGRIERDETPPRWSTMGKVAQALGVTIHDLLEEPQDSREMAEQLVSLLARQDEEYVKAVARAEESGNPQAMFARWENEALRLALATEPEVLASVLLETSWQLHDARRENEKLRAALERTQAQEVTNDA